MLNTTQDNLKAGIKIEMEHKDTYDWIVQYFKKNQTAPPFYEFCKKIAIDHLREDGLYYEKLKKLNL